MVGSASVGAGWCFGVNLDFIMGKARLILCDIAL
jgi:hypothetical protein